MNTVRGGARYGAPMLAVIGCFALAVAACGPGPVTNAQLQGKWVFAQYGDDASERWTLDLHSGPTGDVVGTGNFYSSIETGFDFTVSAPGDARLRFTYPDGRVADFAWRISGQACPGGDAAIARAEGGPLPDAWLPVVQFALEGKSDWFGPAGIYSRPNLTGPVCIPRWQ